MMTPLPSSSPHLHELPKRVTILGSTGSIGCSTLAIIDQHPEAFSCVALTASNNVTLLIEQARKYQPECVAIANPEHYELLKEALSDLPIRVSAGEDAVNEAASLPTDWVMAGIVGMAGLMPTLSAIKQGNIVALANKESLVAAGDIMLRACQEAGATLLPVDSEHNAIFQVFDTKDPDSVEAITLTASGGPFRTWSTEQLTKATVAEAIAHPNWSMGSKISVDSATMMNKGLEMIEAYYLFPVKEAQIRVVVHPESIIHSMVHYTDGSTLAQMGLPDMMTPIAYTMHWPKRMHLDIPKLDITEIGALHFEAPDLERFPCLKLAREALQAGGVAPIILNAANEVAVAAFLKERIAYIDIAKLIEKMLAQHDTNTLHSVQDVLELNGMIRKQTEELIA